MKTNRVNDCIAHCIFHALRSVRQLPDASILFNDVPDIALPYQLIPQIAAHYGLYVTEVPRSLPLHFLDQSLTFIIIYRTAYSADSFHAIISQNGDLFDPQRSCHVPYADLIGRTIAIYLCQPSFSIGQAYAEAFTANQTLAGLASQETL